MAVAQEPETPGPSDEVDRRRAAIPSPQTSLVSISGTLLGTLQWIASGDRGKRSVFGAGSLDVNLIVRPSDSVRIFLDVEGLAGPGPDQRAGTLSRLNDDADRLAGKQETILIRELSLRVAWRDEGVRFSVGKLDVAHYFDRNFFAEDLTTQFLDSALVNNPMLRPPPNGPGAAIRVSVGDWRYAFGAHAPADVDGDLSGLPFLVGELGHRNIFALPGHYRWWARVGSVPEDRRRVTWGTGISIDQLVSRGVGVFLRAGLSREEEDPRTSYAWSAGAQVTPTWITRPHDRVGLGYSEQREAGGRERMLETYYRLSAGVHLIVVANLQWVLAGPHQVTGRTNRNLVVPGVRAVVLF
jgi:hypothetical protein